MKENNFVILSGIFVFILFVGYVWRYDNKEIPLEERLVSLSATKSQGMVGEKISNENGVEVVVLPLDIPSDVSGVRFKIKLDTHSVELSDDLVKSVKLFDEVGGMYEPVSWDGDVPGGHHREGVLRFAKIKSSPHSLTLKMYDVGGVSERVFVWDF